MTQVFGQADVEVFDSYLEVDVATWMSQNQIPYAHEPFIIPSMYGPERQEWDGMVSAIRQTGQGEDVTFNEISSLDILNIWVDLYDKHRLQDQLVSPPVRDSLKFFSKKYVLPDLVIYPQEVGPTSRPVDWDGWGAWQYIVEVSGLYGVGLPDDAEKSDWWSWYRVAGVAFKELAYRLLGIWDDVFFVVPNQPAIEGVQPGIPTELRQDSHYIFFNSGQAGIDLTPLGNALGIPARDVDSSLSPPITPTEYERTRQGTAEISPTEYTWSGLDRSAVANEPNAFIVDEDYVLFAGDIGEVFVDDDTVHVKESQWADENLLLLREYVLDALRQMSESGIVQNLRPV